MQENIAADTGQPTAPKGTRIIVRLRHSLPADYEINTLLPDTLEELEELFKRGELKQLGADIDANHL